MRLYRIEKHDLGKEVTFCPRVPSNIVLHMEDNKTKRVCAASTPIGALWSSQMDMELHTFIEYGKLSRKSKVPIWLYYTDIDNEFVYQPTVDEVSDVGLTGEFWIMKETKFIRANDEPENLTWSTTNSIAALKRLSFVLLEKI